MELDLSIIFIMLIGAGTFIYLIEVIRDLMESHYRSKILQKLPPPPPATVKFLVLKKLKQTAKNPALCCPLKERINND